MPRLITLCQVGPTTPPKMMLRSTFTQKKTVWAAAEKLAEKKALDIFDDVSKRKAEANYSRMCNLLTKAGRVWLLDRETGKPAFLLLEGVANEIRDWDLDGEGEPRYNPAPRGKGEGAGDEA